MIVAHGVVEELRQRPLHAHHRRRVDGKCSFYDVSKSLILGEFCLSLQACGTRSATLQVLDHHLVQHLLLLIVDCSCPTLVQHVVESTVVMETRAEPAAWILRGSALWANAGACRSLFARKQVVASRMV